MILDAAAGNRTMWRSKDDKNIVYIDIEKRLERKPTVFADNTKTPFLDGAFDTIFYDPPQCWGAYVSRHSFPNLKLTLEYNVKYTKSTTYYGWDKYKTKQQLIAHIYYAQKEFRRILKDDGLLWLKWNETRVPLRKILVMFDRWVELMRIYVESPTQTAGIHQTYWVCMIKKVEREAQTRLS